jgi:hypothetical protein
MFRSAMLLFLVLATWVCADRTSFAGEEKPDPAGIEFFEKKIRPVLVEHCYSCHSSSAAKPKGKLLLDSRSGMRKGGTSGPALVPGQPDKSLIVKALKHTDEELRMPEKGKLPEAIIADFEKWIARGAPDPREGTVAAVKGIDWKEARQTWAYQAPIKHANPAVKNQSWAKKKLDFFLLAEMEKRGLKPVRSATKLEWIRRATFDLIGLPPTPAEIDAFVKDETPGAFAKVVDRLLKSAHYGERWGRYWLDLARYADDKALATSKAAPHGFRYRDWVVQALNQDMPYDRFVRLQLAGDLMTEPAKDSFVRLAGLGFQGLGAEYHKGNFAAQVMADELDDRVDTLTRGLLGLTVACARCHDHKYDPIPTLDYYSIATAYQGSSLAEIPISSPDEVARFNAWQKDLKDREAKLNQWLQEQGKKLGKNVKEVPKLLADTERKQYETLQTELEKVKKAAPPAPLMIHGVRGGGQAMKVHIRGNVERQGELAPPGFLRVLQPLTPNPSPARGEGGKIAKQFTRLELAAAIATDKNPLTARVFVNRVWQHHFGRGIVGTPSNFGKLGDAPTHPELLDTLAVRFVESGWSIHWLHREIMLSAAYQMGSGNDSANAGKDPENRYLWRMSPRRLDFEAWRDALLAVSGRLDATLGGPSLELKDAKNVRRTVYVKVSRAAPNEMLTMFDFPDSNVSSDQRSVTTVPQQQLFVLNSDFMIDAAKAFAAKLQKAETQDDKRIELAFRWAYGRLPEASEKQVGLAFLRATPAQDRLTAWEQYAQAILATNEFAWVE